MKWINSLLFFSILFPVSILCAAQVPRKKNRFYPKPLPAEVARAQEYLRTFERALLERDYDTVKRMVLEEKISRSMLDYYLDGRETLTSQSLDCRMQYLLVALRDERLYKRPLAQPSKDDAWCLMVLNPHSKSRYWFKMESEDSWSLNWRGEDGVEKRYETSEGECWLLKYLIEDKVEGGVDRLRFHPKARFGPGKERAVTIAVLGNRVNCVHYLLERGDADDCLEWLSRIAIEKERWPEIQEEIQQRIVAKK